MSERQLPVWTAVAGIATVALTVVAFAILLGTSRPAEDDSPQQVAAFFADHRLPVLIAIYAAALSLGFNLAFYVLLRGVLSRLEPKQDALASLGVIGGAVFIAIAYASFAVIAQLAFREGQGEPQIQRTLYDLYELLLTMTGVPTAVSAVAISLVVLRVQLFPSWIGWYGFAVAAVHLVSVASFAREGFFTPTIVAGTIAPIMYELWVLAISVVLFMRRDRQYLDAAQS